jgi:hypothetical protein
MKANWNQNEAENQDGSELYPGIPNEFIQLAYQWGNKYMSHSEQDLISFNHIILDPLERVDVLVESGQLHMQNQILQTLANHRQPFENRITEILARNRGYWNVLARNLTRHIPPDTVARAHWYATIVDKIIGNYNNDKRELQGCQAVLQAATCYPHGVWMETRYNFLNQAPWLARNQNQVQVVAGEYIVSEVEVPILHDEDEVRTLLENGLPANSHHLIDAIIAAGDMHVNIDVDIV